MDISSRLKNVSLSKRELQKQLNILTFNNTNCYYSCSLTDCLALKQNVFLDIMKERHSAFFKTHLNLVHFQAWSNELSVLKKQLSKLPDDSRGWGIVFERVFGITRRKRYCADVVVLTAGTVFVLEFKMRDIDEPTEDMAKQVLRYAKKTQNSLSANGFEDKNVVPIIVLSKTEGHKGLVKYGNNNVQYCSGDNLFETITGYLD